MKNSLNFSKVILFSVAFLGTFSSLRAAELAAALERPLAESLAEFGARAASEASEAMFTRIASESGAELTEAATRDIVEEASGQFASKLESIGDIAAELRESLVQDFKTSLEGLTGDLRSKLEGELTLEAKTVAINDFKSSMERELKGSLTTDLESTLKRANLDEDQITAIQNGIERESKSWGIGSTAEDIAAGRA